MIIRQCCESVKMNKYINKFSILSSINEPFLLVNYNFDSFTVSINWINVKSERQRETFRLFIYFLVVYLTLKKKRQKVVIKMISLVLFQMCCENIFLLSFYLPHRNLKYNRKMLNVL